MRWTKNVLYSLICIGSLAAVQHARASEITETFDFSFSGFSGTAVPTDPWTGRFTITFDPTVAGSGALDSFSSNLSIAPGPWEFVDRGIGGIFEVGNTCNSGGCAAGSAYSGTAFLDATLDSASTFSGLQAVYADNGTLDSTTTGSITLEATPPAAIPEPGSLLLLTTGLIGIVGLRRHRS